MPPSRQSAVTAATAGSSLQVLWWPTAASGSAIPACAVVCPTAREADGVYVVERPTVDEQYAWIAAPFGVEEGGFGSAAPEGPVEALYDPADGTPAVGEGWGAGADSFLLRRGLAGFRVVGAANPDLGTVPVVRGGGVLGPDDPAAPPRPGAPYEPVTAPGTAAGSTLGGAWIAGLTTADCVKMETLRVSGKCADVALQTLMLESLDGTTWESTSDFVSTGSSGSGVATFVRTRPVPEATLVGVAGWWLGVSGDAHVFAFDSSALCGGARLPCKDFIVVAFTCVRCPVSSGAYRPAATLSMTTAALTTRTYAIVVPPQSAGPAAIRLCLTVPCAGGLRNLTVLLTAPDGTVYTLISAPADLTAQTADVILVPGATPLAGLSGGAALTGVYAPVDDFTAYAGPSGVWALTVVNAGPCAAALGCVSFCFGAVASGLSGFSVSATPSSGAAPLVTALGVTITGAPVMYSVDWGDGSPEAWYASAAGATHTYAADGSYEIVVRAYGPCGGYVEDSVIVTVVATVSVACAGSPVPEALNWEIYDITGDCSCISVTSGVVNYGTFFGGSAWGDIPFGCLLGQCEENSTYYLKCVGTDWNYTTDPVGGGGVTPASITPSPFELIFNKTSPYGPGSYKIRFYA